MNNLKQNTAILIFSRTAKEEAEAKSFHKRAGKKLNQLIARFFITNTKQKAIKTGLPVITLFSNKQVGNTFGERITHGIQQVFAHGYTNVIVLGNDCADLCHKSILKAAAELEKTGFAFGPDERGGAYLIGVSKQHFCEKTLLNISWNTNKVYDELLAYAAANNAPCTELEQKRDMNTQGDLEVALSHLKNDLNLVYSIFLQLAGVLIIYRQQYTLSTVTSTRSLRAPPQ